MAVWNIVNISEIHPDRFDAEYFRKDYQDNIEKIKKSGKTIILGKLFKYINRGSQPLYHREGTLKALRSVNVGFMNFNETRQEYVTEDFFNNNNRGKVQKDDVLITSTGVGTLGRTSIWYKDEKAYCDGHITILRNSEIDPYCITAFLNSKYGLTQFDQNYRGSSGQIEIYPFDISKFVIPECIISFQTEIGNKLREAFKLKEMSRKLYQEANDLLEKELGLSNVKKDYSITRITSLSELTSAKRFDAQCFKPEFLQYENLILGKKKYSRLSSLLNSISKGQQQIISETGKHPYVSIKDISGIEVLPKGNVARNFSIGYKDDLLLAVTGATIGKIGIIHRNKSLNFSGDILSLSVNKSEISPWYLLAVLSSPIGQTQFNRWITGSTNGHLNPSDVKKIIVPRIDPAIEKKIEYNLMNSIELSIKSEQLLTDAKELVENLIIATLN